MTHQLENDQMDITELLEQWAVHPPGDWTNDSGPKGFYAVSNASEGIVAYFLHERDAYRFRLSQINLTLNPST